MSNGPLPQRVKTMQHQGKTIVIIDLSGCKPEETVKLIPGAISLIATFPAKSALLLTDVRGAQYNRDVAAAIKTLVAQNTPYVKASAVVGVSGIQDVLLQTVIMLSRREIKSFQTRDSALNWLASL